MFGLYMFMCSIGVGGGEGRENEQHETQNMQDEVIEISILITKKSHFHFVRGILLVQISRPLLRLL